MIIRNYEELKILFEKIYYENQQHMIDIKDRKSKDGNIKSSDGMEWVLKYDDEGNYTSYPNEELKKSKFIIRKKHHNLNTPMHRHEYMEIVYVLEGQINMNVEGNDIIMEKGNICIMDKNVKHSNKPLDKNDIAVNILLTSEVFDTVFMHLLSDDNCMSNFIINSFYATNKVKRCIVCDIEENSFLENVLINLICEYFSDSIRCQGKINGCLLLLFTELSRGLSDDERISITKKHSKIKSNIMEYLQKEYKNTNLLKAAEYFHFHPNYLSSLVKKEFGKNFKELLGDIRMIEAGKLLRTTDIKINIILENVGYSNEAYFYRQFKKKYNTTPYEYRKQKGI